MTGHVEIVAPRARGSRASRPKGRLPPDRRSSPEGPVRARLATGPADPRRRPAAGDHRDARRRGGRRAPGWPAPASRARRGRACVAVPGVGGAARGGFAVARGFGVRRARVGRRLGRGLRCRLRRAGRRGGVGRGVGAGSAVGRTGVGTGVGRGGAGVGRVGAGVGVERADYRCPQDAGWPPPRRSQELTVVPARIRSPIADAIGRVRATARHRATWRDRRAHPSLVAVSVVTSNVTVGHAAVARWSGRRRGGRGDR
jgi:hypothetical protein